MKSKVLVLLLLLAGALTALYLLDFGADPQAVDPGEAAARRAAGRSASVQTGDDTANGKSAAEHREPVPDQAGGSASSLADSAVTVRGRLVLTDGGAVRTAVQFQERPPGHVALTPADRDLPEPRRQDTDPGGAFRFRVQANTSGVLRVRGDFVLADPNAHARGMRVAVADADVDLGDIRVHRAAVVTGQVVAGGRAVEGVEVVARPEEPVVALGSVGRSSTKTDAQGRFTIRGLAPGKVKLETRSPEFLPATHELELTAGQQLEDVVIRLREGRVLTGTVVDDLDRPVKGATVSAARSRKLEPGVKYSGFAAGESTKTDAAGRFRIGGLADASVRVRASKGGFAATLATATVGQPGLVLRIDRLGRVSGRLVDANGEGIAGSEIMATSLRNDVGVALEMARGEVVRTDAEGRFELAGVKPGRSRIAAKGADHLRVEQEVTVKPGAATKGVELVGRRGAQLTVTVLDLRGQPVVGADVEVATPGQEGRGRGNGRGGERREVRRERRNGRTVTRILGDSEKLGSARTDEHGVAIIRGLPAGSAVVKAKHAELALVEPGEVAVPDAGATTAKLRMQRGGFVAVKVVDPTGESLRDQNVALIGPLVGTDEPARALASSDADGKLKFGPVAPGRYAAVIERGPVVRSVGGGMSFSFPGDNRDLADSRVELAVEAGEATEVELRMPVLTTVKGTVHDARGPFRGAEVTLYAEGAIRMPLMAEFKVRTDGEGRFEIPGVPSGKYALTFCKKGAVVPGEKEIVLQKNQPMHEEHLMLPGAAVSLQVEDQAEGFGVDEAKITLQPYSPRRPDGARPRRMMMIGITADSGGAGPSTFEMSSGGAGVETNASGEAIIEGVPAGKYTLTIEHRDYARVTRVIDVAKDQAKKLGVIAVSPGCKARGRVQFEAGVESRMCTVEIANDDGYRDVQFSRDGAFRFRSLAAGSYKLRARPVGAEDWGPAKTIHVTPDRTPRIDLPLK